MNKTKVVADGREFMKSMSVLNKVLRKVRSGSADTFIGRKKVLVNFGVGVFVADNCRWLDTEKVWRADMSLVSKVFSNCEVGEVELEIDGNMGIVKGNGIKVDFGILNEFIGLEELSFVSDFYDGSWKQVGKIGTEFVDAVSDIKDVISVGIGSFIWSRVGVLERDKLYASNGVISVKKNGNYGVDQTVVFSIDGVKIAVDVLGSVDKVELVDGKWVVLSEGSYSVYCALYSSEIAYSGYDMLFGQEFVPVVKLGSVDKEKLGVLCKLFRGLEDIVVSFESDGSGSMTAYGSNNSVVRFEVKDSQVIKESELPFRVVFKAGMLKLMLDKVDVFCKVRGREEDSVLVIDKSNRCELLYSLIFGSYSEVSFEEEDGEGTKN